MKCHPSSVHDAKYTFNVFIQLSLNNPFNKQGKDINKRAEYLHKPPEILPRLRRETIGASAMEELPLAFY